MTEPERGPTNAITADAARIVALIGSGTARTRTELAAEMGVSRATVVQRLDTLFAAGLIHETSETLHSGGRPARALVLNKDFGIALVADIGETRTRVAVTDLEPAILAERVGEIPVSAGPAPVLEWIDQQFASLLQEVGRARTDAIGIGLSLPAPVDYAARRVVGPSVMTGWDDFDLPQWFSERYEAPLRADNDVNLLALAEHRRCWPDVRQMLFVKLGSGVGSGIITDGTLYRGGQGAAGDIGHIQLHGADEPLCRCGKSGCVEARAAGWALARDLRGKGHDAHDARDVVALVKRNEPEAIALLRRAGRVIGEVIADTISILNPTLIVLGGTLTAADEHLLSGVWELAHQRCLPLATRKLTITTSKLGSDAGILGAAQLVVDNTRTREAVRAVLAQTAARQVSPRARLEPDSSDAL